MTMREAATAKIVDLFRSDENVAVVMADISLDLLRPAVEHDSRRAINVGIMEQTAVGVAAGFALEGFHPIVHTIAPFLAERPLEQIKLDFGYQGLGGLFVSVGASYDYGQSGATHHAPADVQGLGGIPGMEVVVPGTPRETAELIERTYANGRPTYLRTSVVENERDVVLAPGGLTLVRRGAEATVVVAGPFLSRTLAALDGIDATVLYATTLVPLDGETLAREAAPASEVILVEPTYEGTTAAQVVAALSHRPTRLLSLGVPRRFIHGYGTSVEHDRQLGLDTASIRRRIRSFLFSDALRSPV
jgi:transketolase